EPVLGGKARDGAAPEAAADDRRLPQRALLVGSEEVDAREDHALDVVGDLELADGAACAPASVLTHEQLLVEQPPDDLLEVERVALRAREDPFAQVRRQFL